MPRSLDGAIEMRTTVVRARSRSRRAGFALVAILLPLLVFLALEIGFRLGGLEARFPALREMIFMRRGMETIWNMPEPFIAVDAFNEQAIPGVKERYHYPRNLQRVIADGAALPPEIGRLHQFEVVTNSRGFRESEFSFTKPAGVTRVICVGDSWTFGWGLNVADGYPALLGQTLRERYPDAAFEVLNLGIPGLTVKQILALVRDDVRALHPDVVVLGFGLNDHRIGRYGVVDEQSVQAARQLPRAPIEAYFGILEHSDLARAIATRQARAYAPAPGLLDGYAATINELLDMLVAQRIPTLVFTEPVPWFMGMAAYNETLCRIARQHDVPCTDVGSALSSADRVDGRIAEFERAPNWTADFDHAGLRGTLKAELLPNYYLYVDHAHLNRRGNEILVDALAPQVASFAPVEADRAVRAQGAHLSPGP